MPPEDAPAEPDVVALARSAVQESQAAFQAGDRDRALRWLDRAHRLVPHDANVTLALASACLEPDPVRAGTLFQDVAARHDVRQAWLGLAAARLRIAGPAAAEAPLATALSRFACAPDAASLADRIAPARGWCGLRPDGTLEARAAGRIGVYMDGKPARRNKLPPGWPNAREITVLADGAELVGSPLRPGLIRRLAGCVEPFEGGIRGWAWHPADPATDPALTLSWPTLGLRRTFTATDESVTVPDTGPLARCRTFALSRDDLAPGHGAIEVLGPDGTPLPGSPLDPGQEESAHVAAALRLGQVYAASPRPGNAAAAAFRADAPVPATPVGAERRVHGTTVVIPVHDGAATTRACLDSVLASLPDGARVIVVDDGSTDPAVTGFLDGLAKAGKVALVRHARAQGFPAAANAGIRAAKGRDVLLLNSDTLVPVGWIERLREAAYSARDIGTVTPLSNDATILSYPRAAGGNPRPDQAATNRFDRIARRANGGAVVDIPVGVGFCLYLRRDCLNATGAFRADVFAQGYGEENDLCLRARRLGWRNVAAAGVFVGHVGGASFGAAAAHLRARNSAILERLHPGHDALVRAFIERDPLAPLRRRMDRLRFREAGRPKRPSVVLISHDEGGGVEQRLALSARAHAAAGRRAIVLRPAEAGQGVPAIAVRDGTADDLANLVYAMPHELSDLAGVLRAARPVCVEVHHFIGYAPAVYELLTLLGISYDVHIHDYAWICPRVSLVGRDRYCGEPDLHACEACVADNGHFLKETITVAAHRDRSAKFLAAARRVVAPSDDAATRMRRYFPALPIDVVPHDDDDWPVARPKPPRKPNGRARVCVVGGIGVHKGYDIVLACARDAARRDLDLEFVVVGNTIDDNRMLATGRIFVTGRYEPREAADLIGRHGADIGFVASICPETWCLTLGDIWRAGLPAVSFDIGAPAERIRRTGRGFVLPLGLSPSAINNALVAAVHSVGHG